MRKLIRETFVALALVAAVGLVPAHAGAVGYEDSLDDCAYPKAFDALVMRPISFGVMVVGAAALIPLAPVTLWPFTLHRDSGEFVQLMVVPAAKFTFARPLGQCVAVSSGY